MSAEQPPGSGGRDAPQNIATAIADVSERATVLVREEIELAKAEVTEKVTKLAKGAIVGIAAGVFFLMALIFVLIGFAWLLYFYLPVGDFAYFWGFFAMAAILIVLGVLAGLIAARAVKKGSPPVPSMAIAEAQKIREAVSASAPTKAGPSGAPAGASSSSATGSPMPPAASTGVHPVPTPPSAAQPVSASPPAETSTPAAADTPVASTGSDTPTADAAFLAATGTGASELPQADVEPDSEQGIDGGEED